MCTKLLAGLAALIVFTSRLDAAPARDANAKADLEEAAAKLSFLMVLPSMRASGLEYLPQEMADTYRKYIKTIAGERYEVTDLIDLLRHDKPRVRTLAAAALFTRLDPKLLPLLVPLASDNAETFPSLMPVARLAAPPPKNVELPPLEKQTVGKVVSRMLDEYLMAAGYHYGVEGRNGNPGFDDYWESRKDRKYCASWFDVALQWASASTIPTPKDRIEPIKALRKRIDQVPEPDRTFILLALRGGPGAEDLASQKELLELCKGVGSDKLMSLLERKIPSEDPDLRPRMNTNGYYAQMMRFILEHARDLLRPEDADALIGCDVRERDPEKERIRGTLVSPLWYIAAAELKPAKAKEYLTAGWDKFQGKYSFDADHRAQLALTWWRMVSKGDPEFVVKWFYEEKPQQGQFWHCRASVLRELKPADRKLLVALVADKRFAEVDWQSLDQMVQLVNKWDKKPVVSEEERRAAWHPLGMGHFDWARDKAGKDYPKETAALLDTLERWRKALRQRLAE